MTDTIINPRDLAQRSDDWFIARLGSLGASQIGDALSRLKRGGERTKAALDVMYELAAERLTHEPARQVNARQWGVDHEPEARAAYAFLTNDPVVQVGLIPHPTIPNAHASCDALVGDDGGLEIKCPTSATHLRTLIDGVVPEDHLPQIHWSMACAERAWWDFVSYDPRFPSDMQFFVRRVARDEAAIARMEDEARAFLAELEMKLKALDQRYPGEAA
jgi:putative phage-type endonuclease